MLELLLGQRPTFRGKKIAHTATIADTEGSRGRWKAIWQGAVETIGSWLTTDRAGRGRRCPVG
jgi:hypothetical protein